MTPQQWDRIRTNPTLYPNALSAYDPPPDFPWHRYAHSPKSSQVFCFSAFATLKGIGQRDQVIHRLLAPLFSETQTASGRPRRWDISLEAQDPPLLGELGPLQPTSIDVLLSSSREVICVESKFVADADTGLGRCAQFHADKGEQSQCHGFYGPDSDAKTRTKAWCRLETWEGKRSPRLYWLLGRQYFQPHVCDRQRPGDICPLRDGSYQLARNFLFAALSAQRTDKPFFGVLVICPDSTSSLVREQVASFKKSILLPQFAGRVQFVTYETYAAILKTCGAHTAELGGFLGSRIRDVVGTPAEIDKDGAA